MRRRKFLAVSGSLSASLLTGCSGKSVRNPETLRPSISIFMTKRLKQNIQDESNGTATEYSRLVKNFIQNGLSGISSEKISVIPDIKIGKRDVNQDRIRNGKTEDPLGYWDDNILQLVPHDDVSPHSNLLLTAGMPVAKKGYAEFPNCCGTNIPVSMVYSTNASFDTVEDTIKFYYPGYSRMIALHEVGHNLGLKHDMGELKVENDKTVVTPMMAGYVDKFKGSANYFGKKIPNIEKDTNIEYQTYLNQDIKPSMLSLHGGLRS